MSQHRFHRRRSSSTVRPTRHFNWRRQKSCAGLVRRITRGREAIWQLEGRRLALARRHLQTISAQWDETLGRLKAFVESEK